MEYNFISIMKSGPPKLLNIIINLWDNDQETLWSMMSKNYRFVVNESLYLAHSLGNQGSVGMLIEVTD